MTTATFNTSANEKVLDLLRHQLSFQYFQAGVPKDIIASKLHLSKSMVVEMLKGIDKGSMK